MHLNPKLQRRMLGYVAVIAIAVACLQLLGRKPAPPAEGDARNPANVEGLDFEVRDAGGRPLEPDEFRSFPTTELPATPPGTPEVATRAVPRNPWVIDPTWLTAVQDNTLGIRKDESLAFFHVLDRARQSTPQQLERAAEKGVQYINLMQDPSLYRGKPVTLIGDLWYLYEFPATENDYGLTTLYEAWVLTPDSGNQPIRIVCSSLGSQLKVDGPRPTPVRVTGYFFKREGYNSKGGLHVAPTILAGRMERYVSTNAPPPADGLVPVVLGTVVAIGLILATTLVSFAWNDRRAPPRVKRLPSLSTETSEKMAQIDLRSVREQLRDLEERERFADWYPTATGESHEQNGHARDAKASTEEANLPPELPTPLPPNRPVTRQPERDDAEGV